MGSPEPPRCTCSHSWGEHAYAGQRVGPPGASYLTDGSCQRPGCSCKKYVASSAPSDSTDQRPIDKNYLRAYPDRTIERLNDAEARVSELEKVERAARALLNEAPAEEWVGGSLGYLAGELHAALSATGEDEK